MIGELLFQRRSESTRRLLSRGGWLLLLCWSFAAHAAVTPADMVFRGGAILTLDPAGPDAEAVAVRAGRIVYVGGRAGVAPYVGARTQVVELRQRLLMPAFIDAHIHPMSGGLRLLRCNLEAAKSPDHVVAELRNCARHKSTSSWLIVNGLDERFARDPRVGRRALDRLAPDRPLAITVGPGFVLRLNSRALALAGLKGVGASRSDVERDPATGLASGRVAGEAAMAVRRLWPRPSQVDYREALHKASALANRYGIVSVFDANADKDMLDAYHAADRAGELTVRVVAAQQVDPGAGVAQVDAMSARRDSVRSGHVQAGAAKFFLDGEIELHSAAMLQPYRDAPDERGAPIDVARLQQLVTRLDREGFDIHMHAMGDRAVRSGLDAIAQAIATNGPRDRRDQLAHDEVVDPSDLLRFAQLGVAANVQPAWAWHDPVNRDAERRLGRTRADMLVPIGRLFAAGARVVAGSDWPAPVINPLQAIQIAVTRRPLDGSESAWHPKQRVTLMQMLRAYVVDAAWVMRLDQVTGSITVGKAADLIVLDRDLQRVPVMDLQKVNVVMTMFEGRVVYRGKRW